jgi:ATP-dependent Clp protease ATP-binding subunit ClpC
MFERYTETARRVIFFSRYEASQFGNPQIETEHLLLGILRENRGLTRRLKLDVEEIRGEVEGRVKIRAKTSTSVDLPLSDESKRVLAYAAEEAERLGDRHIGSEHLLLGLLREEKGLAAVLLRDAGLRIEAARKTIADVSVGERHAEPHPRAKVLGRPVIEFVENGRTLPVTAQMSILPQTGDEVVLEFEDGQRLYRVESVRFILGHESPEAEVGAQRLNKIQVQVTSIGE